MNSKKIPELDLHGKQEDEIFDLLDRFIREHANREAGLIDSGKRQRDNKKESHRISKCDSLFLEL